MSNEYDFVLTIRPAVSVEERHSIEEALIKLGYVVDGGGQATNWSYSEIFFNRPKVGSNSFSKEA